ncbi:MAG: hypothetical protein ABSA74_03405 [Candidatus Staskawiczbacteria bacterium]|jgi:hypothetical protein
MSEAEKQKLPENPENDSFAIYKATEPEGETERERIFRYTEWARNFLKKNFGVEDLSNIEGVSLRNVVEKLLPKIDEERMLVQEGKMSAIQFAEIEEEAAALWLYEDYGIHPEAIPMVFIVEDETDGKKYQFEKIMEKEAREKYSELDKQGHNVYLLHRVPDDFKNYLKKIREDAHKP